MKPTPASPVAPGPQIGAPPSLEQIPLDRLSVDPAYQRATDGEQSRRLIAAMVRAWKWPLCQPLVVSRRGDGALYVLDGQHRLAGARARGDIPFLPCVVLSSLDIPAEARAFVELNTHRQRLSQTDIFNGQLAAGDEAAKEAADLLAEAGWRIVRSSATDSWLPGDLACAPRVAQLLRSHGRTTVRAVLLCLRSAYRDRVITAPANLIEALVALIGKGGALENCTLTELSPAMAAVDPGQWLLRASALRSGDPTLSRRSAVMESIRRQVISHRAAPAPAAPPLPARPVPPVAPRRVAKRPTVQQADPFGASGKGWCEQCEQLVNRATADKCRSAFCKMRSMAA